jgi:hypothetical protein
MVLVPVAANAAPINTFTNAAEWTRAALGTKAYRIVVEDFNDPTLVPGLSFTQTATNCGSLTCGVNGGVFNDRVTAAGGERTVFFFNLSEKTYAMGGNWDLAGPGGPGESLNLVAHLMMGNVMVGTAPTIPNTLAGGLFGFTSSLAFDRVQITSANIPSSAVAETYTLENLRIAVPEPATLTLFGFGLAGLGLMMRRRRKHA